MFKRSYFHKIYGNPLLDDFDLKIGLDARYG